MNLNLYQKYKYLNWKTEYIYIGEKNKNNLYFLYKDENCYTRKQFFINRNLNFDQIVKDLNLELNKNGDIKNYDWACFGEEQLEDFRPILKDKLKNLLNR